MSREYSNRSRSRSRDHGASRNQGGSDRNNAGRSTENSAPEFSGSISWSDKFKASRGIDPVPESDTLASELGYSDAGWDSHKRLAMSSMGSWGNSVSSTQSAQPQPPPPPPRPAQSESEQWGYNPKPYVAQAVPLNIPILANPVVQPPPPPPPASQMVTGAHLVVENIPAELNMMSLLYEHFKQFGEVVSIHCIQKYSKALVDFRTHEVAESAASAKVLGVPSIKVSVFNGPSRGPGRANPPGGPLPGQQGLRQGGAPANTPAPTGLTKNMVLESEAARKARERREQHAEGDKKRIELLTAYTEHVKQIVAKLADRTLKEDVRAKYMEMLTVVKSKISDLQKVDNERRKRELEATQKALAVRYKAFEKQARLDSNKRQAELTLDLRSRCVKISDLPEELSQSIVLSEYLRAMGMKELDDVIWLGDRSVAVLRFESHPAADQLVKHELAFRAEWVSNADAANLAATNVVEKMEIAPLDEDNDDLASLEETTAGTAGTGDKEM